MLGLYRPGVISEKGGFCDEARLRSEYFAHVLRARCMVACQRFYGQSTQILRMVTSVPRIYLSPRGNG